MQQWINKSQPPTLMAGVILGYIAGLFSIFEGGVYLPLGLGLMAGAFGTANNRNWGYYLLAICAVLRAALFLIGPGSLTLYGLLNGASIDTTFFINLLSLMNRAVFPVALAAAVLHPHSREYQRVWFE